MSVKLDIIVPVYNEADNVALLVERTSSALKEARISFRLFFVDDHSSDETVAILKSLQKKYPITVLSKKGQQGKAFSILEAVPETTAPYLAMIDADLQYPPEVFPQMLQVAEQEGVAVARRNDNHEGIVRKTLSRGFRWFFGKILHGLDCDVQSGMKVFRREIIEQVNQTEVTPWTLDLPLLTNALNLGFSIGEVAITFAKRNSGESKIKFVSSISEIGGQAIKYKLTPKHPILIAPDKKKSMIGAGLYHKGKKFITHTTLQPKNSALDVVTTKQQLTILSILLTMVLFFIFLPMSTAKVVVGIMSLIYFLDVVFNFYLILKSLHNPPEVAVSDDEITVLKDTYLPIYTILCPLYKEAHVIPQFLEAIEKLNWPKNKLDVQLLLEEDDVESVEAVKKMKLPSYVRMVVVPDSQPKTKPKACNYGLSLARGEYVVIYDAEDAPDPDQLKKSFVAFQKVGPNIKCLQAKLNYYNPEQNWLTRLFTAEYSTWFDVILTGMQSIETTIPLGGTSNHFRTADLLELQGWDPFNVTEDADLGVRLFSKGYKTAIIDSTTLEEANSNFKNWIRQRSRWIKGYMQTYLLHMRNPVELAKQQGIHALLFQLTVGGKISFILINPFLWLLTIAYFTLYAFVGPTIEVLYPSVIFYMAVISLIFGNFMFIYYYMIGVAKRENWPLMKWVYLVPFYWLMVSISGAMALYQLIVKPHYWEKTIHGLHLKAKEEIKEVVEDVKEEVEEVVEEATTNVAAVVMTEMQQQFEKVSDSRVNFNPLQKLKEFGYYKQIAEKSRSGKKLLQDFVTGKYRAGSLLVIATVGANFLNMATNFYLGKELNLTDFALFNTYLSILNIFAIFLSALSATVNQKSAEIFGKTNKNRAKNFWNYAKNRVLFLSILMSMVWLAIIPWVSSFLNFHSVIPLLLFTPIVLIGGVGAVNTGYLRGSLAFDLIAVTTILQPFVRLMAAILLSESQFEHFAYLSIPLSYIAAVATSHYFARQGKDVEIEHKQLRFPKTFFLLALLTNVSSIAFFSLDNIFVSHFLTQQETGLYGILGLLGKMIFFSGSLITGFILPLTAYREGKGLSSEEIFKKLVLLATVVTAAAFILIGILLPILAPQYLGDKINAVRTLLPVYSIGIMFYTISQAVVQFHLAKKHYAFAGISFILALIQVLGLSLFHDSLADVVLVMAASGVFNLLTLALAHRNYEFLLIMIDNLHDLVDLAFGSKQMFAKDNDHEIVEDAARILIFNWRDIKHTWAGGAEVYLHQIAEELQKKGHKVTIFCGNDGKHPRNEVINGVQIIRRGGFYTVYIWAFLYYVLKFRGIFDYIIDSENGIPFFTPLFVRKPIFLLIHHVHQEVFRTQLKFPFSEIASMIEADLMPAIYKQHTVITVSESSKKEIVGLGMGTQSSIKVINPGITAHLFKKSKKTSYPSLVYVGRLKPYKSVDTAVMAFSKVLKEIPNAKFKIAGTGESLRELKELTQTLGIEKNVEFLGNVNDAEKAKLFAQSWVAVQPSMIEGWGITVIEANASGTPVVASNTKGLKDSVIDGKTGVLVNVKDHQDLADAIINLLNKDRLRERMSKNAYSWSQNFDWGQSATELFNVMINSKKTNHKKLSRDINPGKVAYEN